MPVQKKPRREVTGSGEDTDDLLVLVVGDRLEPIGRAHRDGQVQEIGGGRAAVPVALARGDVGDVARLEDHAAALIRGPQQAAPVRDVQDLCRAVAMPVGARAGGEEDDDALVGEDDVAPHLAGERVGAPLGGLALAAADDLHVGSLVWSWMRTPPAMSPSASTTRLEICSP